MVTSVALEYPFRIDGAGRVAQTEDPGRQIVLRLTGLIGTLPGERVFRPAYGTAAPHAVFDVNDTLSQSELAGSIRDAVANWEPSAVIDNVDVQSQDPAGGQVICVVNYHLVTTGDAFSLSIRVGATVTYGWEGG